MYVELPSAPFKFSKFLQKLTSSVNPQVHLWWLKRKQIEEEQEDSPATSMKSSSSPSPATSMMNKPLSPVQKSPCINSVSEVHEKSSKYMMFGSRADELFTKKIQVLEALLNEVDLLSDNSPEGSSSKKDQRPAMDLVDFINREYDIDMMLEKVKDGESISE